MTIVERRLRAFLALLAFGVAAIAAPVCAHVNVQHLPALPVMDAKVTVSGLLDGRQDRINFDAVAVSINGQPVKIDKQGHFAVQLDRAPYYRMDIQGEDIFAMVQTFGDAELIDTNCQCRAIPAVELIKRKPGRIELFFGGDTMAGRRFFETTRDRGPLLRQASLADDLDQLLEPIRPYFATSDFASVNLESVLARDVPGPNAPKRIVFYSPPELAQGLARAGIDYVTLGNNHSFDYLDEGLAQTIESIEAAGLAWSGAGLSQDQAFAAAHIDVGGRKLSMLGFVGWRGNWTPNQAADETKGGAAYGSAGNIGRAVRREDSAGRVPIVQYHGGGEYSDRPDRRTVQRAHRAIEGGAPLVAGHHPHRVHGLEVYRGGLIAYSLGNFLFDQTYGETHATFVLKVWMEKDKVLRAEIIPVQMLDYRPVPAVGAMREAILRRVVSLSAELGTQISISGGHGVVHVKGHRRPRQQFGPMDARQCGAGPAAEFRLAQFLPDCILAGQARDVLMRGDFENALFDNAADRSWMAQDADLIIRDEQQHGRYLSLLPQAGEGRVRLFLEQYLRKLSGGRYLLRGKIRLPGDAYLELAIKEQPPRGSGPSKRWEGDVVARTALSGGPQWQDFTFEFSHPAKEAGAAPNLALRPILQVDFGDAGAAGNVDFDDLAMIEWGQPEPGVTAHAGGFESPSTTVSAKPAPGRSMLARADD